MKLKHILLEAPLPDEWDKSVFKKDNLEKAIEYAKEKAKYLGEGISRVALTIPYQGRDTVLKVAKDQTGIKCNESEAKVLSQSKNRLCVPIIDDANDNTWIHMEYAKQFTIDDYEKFFGNRNLVEGVCQLHFLRNPPKLKVGLDKLELKNDGSEEDKYINEYASNNRPSSLDKELLMKWLSKYYPYLIDLKNLSEWIENNIGEQYDDFHYKNFGWYHNKPVVIDAGVFIMEGDTVMITYEPRDWMD